jgi:hypothetical protein
MIHHQRNPTKQEADNHSMRLAVLIDADNAQAAVIESLLTEVAGIGEAVVKRIYGDFTSPHSAAWKKVLQRHAIKPVQQFAYTTGKNATDSTLIIDAMDLLYTRNFDGFCLVTSDSDSQALPCASGKKACRCWDSVRARRRRPSGTPATALCLPRYSGLAVTRLSRLRLLTARHLQSPPPKLPYSTR